MSSVYSSSDESVVEPASPSNPDRVWLTTSEGEAWQYSRNGMRWLVDTPLGEEFNKLKWRFKWIYEDLLEYEPSIRLEFGFNTFLFMVVESKIELLDKERLDLVLELYGIYAPLPKNQFTAEFRMVRSCLILISFYIKDLPKNEEMCAFVKARLSEFERYQPIYCFMRTINQNFKVYLAK